jgi:ABC-2 type transport system permease protein
VAMASLQREERRRWRLTPREPAVGTRESATGAIYDLGYRGYDGPRLGRPAAVATLFWASLRAAYGLKRSGKAKIVPWGLAALLVAPAAVSVAVAALAPGAPAPFTYDDYLWGTSILLAIFVAAQAPELVSSDQRHRVLSLYFSHALERSDYALAKLGALAAAIFGMALAPMLVLFIGRVLLAADVVEAFGDELENLPQVLVAPFIYAVPLAALSLAIAAFTPRRAYATGAIIAVFIVSTAIGGILGNAITTGPLGDLSQLLNPFVPIDGTRNWLVGNANPNSPVEQTGFPLYLFGAEWLAIAVVGGAAVVWRYRRVAA